MFKTADKNARSNLLRLCSGGLFRTQSNIYDRAAKKTLLQMFDRVLNTPLCSMQFTIKNTLVNTVC